MKNDMTYTIKQLADLAGVGTRTLRYYDEIGLLSPKRTTGSEYRIYSEAEVDRLQISTPKYTVQMHRGLAEMYVADERFKAYYDGEVTGCAQFLRDAVTEHIN